MEQSLAGMVALVTGSSRGLGLILARGLGRAGATVVLNGRDRKRLTEAETALREEGLDVTTQLFDITDEAEVGVAVSEIEERVGPIEILVNNAGRQHREPLEGFPRQRWDELFETNITGAFLVGKAVANRMIPRRRGKIINICSLQSELGRETIAPYAATKGALLMLTRGMCVDWAKYNIQVNALAPGYFETEMTQPLRDNEEFDRWLRKRTPAGKWGDPEELIPPLLLFASPQSTFIQGQILYVDGGITAAV
ncbi:MAG: SDR family oxidoreductase [Spirochaeta sp.]|nr:SDR family oxidoreductase [Spirochaeta sp.]